MFKAGIPGFFPLFPQDTPKFKVFRFIWSQSVEKVTTTCGIVYITPVDYSHEILTQRCNFIPEIWLLAF